MMMEERPGADGAARLDAERRPDDAVRADSAGGAAEAELDATGGGGGTEETPPAEAALDEARARLEELNDRYVRLLADFDNYRKRAQREKQELLAGPGEGFVLDLLPVLDNLERAVAAARNAARNGHALESLLKGVELTMRMFQGVLARNGVERIAAAGEPFDPHRHEALVQEERDGVSAETVVEELEAGYVLRGRVLRPAKVKVAKPRAGGAEEAPPSSEAQA
jgi:molecular chaperone GrpE